MWGSCVRRLIQRTLSAVWLTCLFLPTPARAGLNGLLELQFSTFDSKTEELLAGGTTETNARSLSQKYHLGLQRSIFPNLTLNANGVFERNSSDVTTDGLETETTTTLLRPFVEVRLSNPLYNASLSYNRREEETRTGGASAGADIAENYNAFLSWKPAGLPSLNVRLNRTDLFDEERLFKDTTSDSVSFNTEYGYKGLALRYQGTLDNSKDRKEDLDVHSSSHTGRTSYSLRLLKGRISLGSSYNVSQRGTEVSTTGESKVEFPILLASGLFALDDTPEEGSLDSEPAVVLGNASINIGVRPFEQGDLSLRNVGLEFSNRQEVNTLFVYVNRGLPFSIASSFFWSIYVSQDNIDWELVAIFSPAPFSALQNRFEIEFPSLTTRFIKIVTSPLDPISDPTREFLDIFITRLQALLTRTVTAQKDVKVSSLSQLYNFDGRARLLQVPSLYYDLSYFLTRTETSRSAISNRLSFAHAVTKKVFTTARMEREDLQGDEGGFAYKYSASLSIKPLETLTNSLNYSGATEEIAGEKTARNSIFFNSRAELYEGISANLSQGLSFQERRETDEKRRNYSLSIGLSIIPNPKVTLDLRFTGAIRKLKIGDLREESAKTSGYDLRAAIRPFMTLYIFTSLSQSGGGKGRTLQNYSVNWSPFPEGTLQFTFSFNEFLGPGEGNLNRSYGPSLRWNITHNKDLSLFYSITESRSTSQIAKSDGFSVMLKTFF